MPRGEQIEALQLNRVHLSRLLVNQVLRFALLEWPLSLPVFDEFWSSSVCTFCGYFGPLNHKAAMAD